MITCNSFRHILTSSSIWISAEAVAQRCSVKKRFLDISQNSQENTCSRISFLIKLKTCNFIKKETLTQVFSCELCEISKNTPSEHLLVLKTSWRLALKTFSRRVLKKSWRHTLKTSWRHHGEKQNTYWGSNKSKCVSNKSIFHKSVSDNSKANPECIN